MTEDNRKNNGSHLAGARAARVRQTREAKTKRTCDGCEKPLTKSRTVAIGTNKFCYACHVELWRPTELRKRFKSLIEA